MNHCQLCGKQIEPLIELCDYCQFQELERTMRIGSKKGSKHYQFHSFYMDEYEGGKK